jgi:hypothetical protein
MRCSKIDVLMRVPVLINEPDFNGNCYTEECIRKACENGKLTGLPLTTFGEDGEQILIGIIKSGSYANGEIIIEGRLFYSGTYESVGFDENKQITEMDIQGFAFTD